MSKLLATRATANPTIGQATGFELASPDRWTAGNIDSALERNRVFAAAGGHRAAVVFPTLRPSGVAAHQLAESCSGLRNPPNASALRHPGQSTSSRIGCRNGTCPCPLPQSASQDCPRGRVVGRRMA